MFHPLPEAQPRDASSLQESLPKARLLVLSLGLVTASLVWLSLSSRLTAAGQRIVEMETRRKILEEGWISAVERHGRATDPAALQRRAAALGLQPMSDTEVLWLTDPRALPQRQVEVVDQALGTARRAALAVSTAPDSRDLGGMLLGLGVAEAASADMLRADER